MWSGEFKQAMRAFNAKPKTLAPCKRIEIMETFSYALKCLKRGRRVARHGWNGLLRHRDFYPTSRDPVVHNGVCYTLLDTGAVAICDAADLEKINQKVWYDMKGYAATYTTERTGKARPVKMHQIIFPSWGIGDHKNGDTLDNRRENLRECSAAENARNSSSQNGSTSRYRGVSWDSSRSRWIVSLQTNGSTRHVGRFFDERDAAAAYDAAASVAYGEFARLNFPEPEVFIELHHVESGGTAPVALPCMAIKTNDGNRVPWLPNAEDLLAEDWFVLEEGY